MGATAIMEGSHTLLVFSVACALKILLIPAYHSTDFEVHRNWLAITDSLPIDRWYVDATSEWTLDYPPFFAYFEWLLAQAARYVDPKMLVLTNLNYASDLTKYFQRGSVMCADIIFLWGVRRALQSLRLPRNSAQQFTGEVLLLLNVGLLFIDHIHFQYNGFLFGILLLAISFILEERYLLSAFLFASLLNFKHIFLYMAPPFGVFLLKFYCLRGNSNPLACVAKLGVIGLVPFALAFGPFYKQLPQVLSRLFPFKRGLTHAYWAPNFWALYNTADKVLAAILKIPQAAGEVSSTSGLVQEVKHVVLPTIKPWMTFALSALFMLPILLKLSCGTDKSRSKPLFLRALVLCSCASFLFGWHVHEKAILMTLIPLSLLCLLQAQDARYNFLLSVPGYFSLFPLLFHTDLLVPRYALYLAYMGFLYSSIWRMHKAAPCTNFLEELYVYGFAGLPFYEHVISPLMGWHKRLPFMALLLTSFYCSLGILYFFVRYYLYALDINIDLWGKTRAKDNKQRLKTGKGKKLQ